MLTSARPVVPEAYGLVLKGRQLGSVGKAALDCFERAVALDPTYAPAQAGIAMHYVAAGFSGYMPASEAAVKARVAAVRALELDDSSAEAHASLGGLLWALEWDWAGAERELLRAIELDPSRSETRHIHAHYLMVVGRLDEAIAEARRAMELDPLAPTRRWLLGMALFYARQHEEAIAVLRETVKMDPSVLGPWARALVALNYAEMHRYGEAVAECDAALAASPDLPLVQAVCGGVYGLSGDRQKGLALLQRLLAAPPAKLVDPCQIASVYDCLGDADHAIEWLERAVADHWPTAGGLAVGHWSDRVRSDPRFEALVRRMNYPGNTP